MARLSPRSYRIFGSAVLLLLIYWKLDWVWQSDYTSAAKTTWPAELRKGPVVYASEEHKNTTVVIRKARYRWSTLHSNVLSEGNDLYLETLAFLEDLTYDGAMSVHHQVIVPSDVASLIDQVTCSFAGGQSPVTVRYEMPHAWYAILLRCKIPADVKMPDAVSIDIAFHHQAPSISHRIDLKPYAVEESHNTPNMAICISPMFGHLNMFRILEWRLHHARLGVKTVHWYSRRPNVALERLVTILNDDADLKDTWKEAAPISPDTFEKEHLQEHGLYGDQVLYYIDCLERSKHLHPTHWLAFMDLDEFFLPDPFDLSGIDDFLDLKNHSDASTICIDRNQAETAQDHEERSELLFEHIDSLVERKEDHPTDNRKCIHRPGSLLVPFVHWSLLVRDGKPSQDLVYTKESSYLRLLHASSKQYWGDKLPLVKTEAYNQHVHLLRASGDYYLRTYPELFR